MDMTNAINSKVCIVLAGIFVKSNYECMVFVVDLRSGLSNSGDKTDDLLMSPTVRFNGKEFNLPAVCVLGSKMYIFEDYHKKLEPNNPRDGKTPFTYDLCDGVGVKLDKSMTLKEPPMKHTKVIPKATVTPDGKILVFSSLIQIYHSRECDFELYDPCGQRWFQLPNLPVRVPGSYSFRVTSCTFIDKDIFFVTTEKGNFALDLLKNDWVWERSVFPGDQCIPPHYGGSFVVIGRDILVVPVQAYDIGCVGITDTENIFCQVHYKFPELSSFSRSSHSCGTVAITLLEEDGDKDEEVFTVCFIHTGVNEKSMLPELMLQVYTTHIPTCKKSFSMHREQKLKENSVWWKRKNVSSKLSGTSKVKSLKIVVPEECRSLGLCSFASILD